MKYKRIITEVIIAKSNYSRNFLHLIMKRPGTIPLTKPSPGIHRHPQALWLSRKTRNRDRSREDLAVGEWPQWAKWAEWAVGMAFLCWPSTRSPDARVAAGQLDIISNYTLGRTFYCQLSLLMSLYFAPCAFHTQAHTRTCVCVCVLCNLVNVQV